MSIEILETKFESDKDIDGNDVRVGHYRYSRPLRTSYLYWGGDWSPLPVWKPLKLEPLPGVPEGKLSGEIIVERIDKS